MFKKTIVLSTISFIISFNIFLCTQQQTDKITDIDGYVYSTIKIGNQWWMAENLKVTHYRNGDAIPNITDDTEWSNPTAGAYCNYDNNDDNVDTYGRLYNGYAVIDSRNIAPEGWHVPSDEEWKELEIFLGMNPSETENLHRGTNEGGKLKETGSLHWNSPNTDATNENSFTALPSGYRDSDGNYGGLGQGANFWSSTRHRILRAWFRILRYNKSDIGRGFYDLRSGFAIRCVKD
jgi:uncharacterized protein (TIGR02145 family)